MPRSIAEVLAHADELAARFEAFEPTEESRTPADTLAALRTAVVARAAAERAVLSAVVAARTAGQSWAAIGAMMGTTGEAARQRYRSAEREAIAQSDEDRELFDRNYEILTKAGFTAEELRDFAGVLQFGAVLAQAGHVGPVADLEWTEEKAKALVQVLTNLGPKFGFHPGPPPEGFAGPEIHVRGVEPLPFPAENSEPQTDDAPAENSERQTDDARC